MTRVIDLGPIRRRTRANPGSVPEPEEDTRERLDWSPWVAGPEGYCPITVLCDAPTPQAESHHLPLQESHAKLFGRLARKHGFVRGDMKLINVCPPIPRQDLNSASRKWKHVERYLPNIHDKVAELNPQIVVTFGELATRAMTGRAVKITKVRGIPIIRDEGPPLLPMLSPGFIARIPDHESTFEADVVTLSKMKEAGYDTAQFTRQDGDYEWCCNVQRIRNDIATVLSISGAPHAVISVDTEGTGLRWWDPNVVPFCVQISIRPGHAYVIPVNEEWWDDHTGEGVTDLGQVRLDLKDLLEDPNVKKVGHNIKFETMHLRKLNIDVKGWLHDTQLMLFGVNENLMDKRLETGVKIYVPEMGGYSDQFDQEYDKSRMWDVPKEDVENEDGSIMPGLKTYAGGDSDATLRLAQRLRPLLNADARQLNVYRRIQMPSIQCFANTLEPHGLLVDQERLEEFGETLDEFLVEAYASLIARTPAAVKADHLERGKELKFSRADFIRDILFTPQGFNLRARTWTDSTKDLPAAQRQPSTSAKTHLPYFTNEPALVGGPDDGTVGDYVTDLTAYQKAQKLNTTYVGRREHEDPNGGIVPANGLWQYLAPWGRIHPSYMLHRTNTGRTASADPNGQNFPNRGDWAKAYKECFSASPGFKLVSCDLSQIELRLVAWMSGDPVMLAVYKAGGDIHATTAATIMGLTLEQFMALPDEVRGLRRFNAKSVNFGFIYGMSAGGFQTYAKTEYKIDYNEDECQAIRSGFFDKYAFLPYWHRTMHDFAREHGYVRALHGAVRHVPSIYSDDEAIVAAARRYAVNSPIQRLGSDMGLIGLIRFCHQADPRVMRVTGFVHDALYMEVREDYTEEAAAALKWCMETPPLEEWFGISSPIPIVSDPEIDGEERPDIAAWKPDWWNDDEAAVARAYECTSVIYT